jgi:DNA (cytosine-5)-methyltransferase 1
MKSSHVAVVDLFAGAGGFGVAAEMAGADLRLSVEWDAMCCFTLDENRRRGHRVEHADVKELSGSDLRSLAELSRSDPLVIVGGPPCQPFSKASYWTDPGNDARFRRARAEGRKARRPKPITKPKSDERRDLLGEYHRLVMESNAMGFVMENVTSLLHPRNVETFNRLVRSFEGEGFSCTVVKASATSFGVPQKRNRIFLLGSRNSRPRTPSPIYKADVAEEGFLPAPRTAGEVMAPFSGIDFYESGEEVEGRWAECLRQIPPGWNYKHLTAWAGHPTPLFEAETRFWNFLLKLAPDAPSWTINANPGPWVGPFHWESRRLRTPELAAIQTFPASYVFHGNRRERVRQIGNAVPPLLAKPMIEAVTATLS